MKSLIRMMLTVLALATIGSTQVVSYNFSSDASFAGHKTCKWVEIPGGVKLDDITADRFIGYQVAVTQEKSIGSYDTGWGYGPRSGNAMGMTTATTDTLHVGSVDLDMYDAAKKQLVWRGVATKTIDAGAKPEKLLKNYPPKQK